MPRTLRIGIALTIALMAASPAIGSDLIAPTQSPPVPAGWTGFYLGVNAGYSWGETNKVQNKQGFTGGGQIGYDLQLGHFVAGVEADLDWRKATNDVTGVAPNGIDIAIFHSEQNWWGTVRPRFGVTLYNLMMYGTGGFLYGDLEHRITETRTTVAGATRTGSVSGIFPGWTAGAGLEWELYRWILGVEWLHLDYNVATIPFPDQTLGGVHFPAQSIHFHDRSEIVRLKVNYKFNWIGRS
jgi:outer membrane immunogenic protein